MKKKNTTRKNTVAVDGGKIGVNVYADHDVIITEHEEVFFYWEAKEIGLTVLRKATKKQSVEYVKQFDTQQQITNDNEHDFYYHELRD